MNSQDKFIDGVLNQLLDTSRVTCCYCYEDIYLYKFDKVGWFGGVDLIVERLSNNSVKTKRVVYGVEMPIRKFCKTFDIEYNTNDITNIIQIVQKQAETFKEELRKELIKRDMYETI